MKNILFLDKMFGNTCKDAPRQTWDILFLTFNAYSVSLKALISQYHLV